MQYYTPTNNSPEAIEACELLNEYMNLYLKIDNNPSHAYNHITNNNIDILSPNKIKDKISDLKHFIDSITRWQLVVGLDANNNTFFCCLDPDNNNIKTLNKNDPIPVQVLINNDWHELYTHDGAAKLADLLAQTSEPDDYTKNYNTIYHDLYKYKGVIS